MTMNAAEARATAARWIAEHSPGIPGFVGAFLSGSVAWLPADAPLSPASDVDVMVVLSTRRPPPKPGKFRYGGALLEITYLGWEPVPSSEEVLGSYHLAGALRGDTVLADPTGALGALREAVSRGYARRKWVLRRCEEAENKVTDGLAALAALDVLAPPYDRVTGWLFPTGVTTHVLLTAGLRNPTVRLRYLAARSLLLEYGRPEVHEELLELLGCAHLDAERVARHLRTMTEAFDAASAGPATPYPFASDIAEAARPVAVGGGHDLLARGHHREAVFWIAATYARCLKILAHDGREAAFMPGFLDLAGDLGVETAAGLRERALRVRAYLPRLRRVRDDILAANPDITG
ncbi:hypothetical protein [Streptosporangium saharense]|uniref:Uncharacterized protein n=1 Tax=Streptosporangium saharense TaxID=1706840 RepID=A0A7W7QVA7_9ACTN|nr:hypothetical protein [Streptosporangium saharense]MBB4919856.1 hypothetical protein [Streptosporangium saharense]